MIFKKRQPPSLDLDRQKESSEDDSEIDITEYKTQSFFDLFRIVVTYLSLLMIKVWTFASGLPTTWISHAITGLLAWNMWYTLQMQAHISDFTAKISLVLAWIK